MSETYNGIGSLLRRAREEQRIDLVQAAQMLHIRPRYIEALESGRLSELPGLAYAKGYLQAYANLLGLDKGEVLRRFEEAGGLPDGRGFYIPDVLRKEKRASPLFIWGGLGAGLLVYLFWLMFLQPTLEPISIVEPFIRKEPEARFNSRDVACLQALEALYPPCTAPVLMNLSLLPLPKQVDSVLQLGVTKW